MTIDWSKAPEGATHLTLPNGPNRRPVFWRVADGIAREAWPMENDFSVVRDHFRYGADGCASFIDWLAIPKPAPWNGEGLPPAGTVCEFSRKGCGNWGRVEILYVGKQRIFFRDRDGDELSRSRGDSEFRPIRTAEQIAEDEREAGIREIATLMAVGGGFKEPCAYDLRDAAAVWDAGYRKQVAQ
ncbi:hypothetical protein V2J91_23505 [Pseudomonas alliivorans]|nr:hypothetical protein [Pseudomonas alliivorans]